MLGEAPGIFNCACSLLRSFDAQNLLDSCICCKSKSLCVSGEWHDCIGFTTEQQMVPGMRILESSVTECLGIECRGIESRNDEQESITLSTTTAQGEGVKVCRFG